MNRELLTLQQEFSEEKENKPFGSVENLLADKHLNGDDILNYFTGSLLRHGSFETSQGSDQQIGDVLKTLTAVAALEAKNQREEPNPYAKQTAKSVTRNDGLRDAIEQLGQDERVQEAALADVESDSQNGIARRLARSLESNEPVLANVEQIEGYLFGDPDANEVNYQNGKWVQDLSEKIKYVIEGQVDWPKQDDVAWRSVANNANAAGIDLVMLRYSADRIRHERKRNQEFGRVSLGNLARTQEADLNYDDLLIETPPSPSSANSEV